MNKVSLLNKLENVTDKVAFSARHSGFPLALSKNRILVGNISIEKNREGFYNIMSLSRDTLYKDVSSLDIAVIISQRYNMGEFSVIRKILELDEKYSKYYIDMMHYIHCFKSAKSKNDKERMAILEDKFRVSEIFAKDIKSRILVFKKTK